MKAILEFDLDNEEDGERHTLILSDLKYKTTYLALCDINQKIKQINKYETLTEETAERFSKFHGEFFEILKKYYIELN